MIKDILQQLAPLDEKIAALRGDPADENMTDITNHAAELAELSAQEDALLSGCGALTAEDRVFLARHPERPHIDEIVDALFTDFFEQCGDRQCKEDAAILGGVALFHGQPVTVIGHRKGSTLEENLRCNFGMPGPEGYRKALRLMKQAEKFDRPIITFIDTPGAYPGKDAEERGQGEAIARNLMEMSDLTVPVIAVVTGEGSSGGALALAGTDSSHIALREGEEVPLADALYATQMASANDGANLLAEYFGGGTIADGVAAMNAQVEELGLAHTHFSNPHGISDDDHYTSCYDMAQILRWALQQPGFEDLFTRNEMYTMQPTNIQPVTRYFSQQDKIRIGSSRYHIDSVLGSKLGYTNTARYSYVCLAEQDGVRLICATMQSQLSTDKYNDMRTLLDYAFSTYKSYTQLPGGTVTAQLAVAGGGQSLGTVTVADPGVKLLLAEGLSAQDVTVDLELPEQYLLGAEPAVYAVYTLNGGAQQESTSVRVKAEITGLAELLEQSVGTKLEAARDVEPGSSAWLLAGISVGCTIGAAMVTVLVLRVHSRLKKRRKTARHHKKA